MLLSGSDRGLLYDFDAQLEEIDIDNLVFMRSDWRIQLTGDEPNLVSPWDDQIITSLVDKPPDLFSLTNQE